MKETGDRCDCREEVTSRKRGQQRVERDKPAGLSQLVDQGGCQRCLTQRKQGVPDLCGGLASEKSRLGVMA